MLKQLLWICLTAPALFVMACEDNNLKPSQEEDRVQSDNFIFQKSSSRVDEIAENRSSDVSDPFEINDVWIEEDDGEKWMHIEVIQTKGCEAGYPEKYEVIWDGIMLMIYPPQIGFYLVFDSSKCAELDEAVKDTIILDLYELFGSKDLVDPAKFTIINASKSSSENDYEIDME